jgi:hypothetical protein
MRVCTVGGFHVCVAITASITSPEVASPRAQNSRITTHSASDIDGGVSVGSGVEEEKAMTKVNLQM